VKSVFESASDNIEPSDHQDGSSEEYVESTFRSEETVVSTNVRSRDSIVRKVTKDFSDGECDERSEVDERDGLEVETVTDRSGKREDDRGSNVDA
jgi:hypothetical protein